MKVFFKILKWWLIISFFIAILITVFSKSKTTEERELEKETYALNEQKKAEFAKTAELNRIKSLPQITPDQLIAEYLANEVAANQRFKDKEFMVTGVVSSIGVSLGEPYVTLQIKNQTGDTRFSFEENQKNESSIAKLSKGNKISLVCFGGGLGAITNKPMSKNCSLL